MTAPKKTRSSCLWSEAVHCFAVDIPFLKHGLNKWQSAAHQATSTSKWNTSRKAVNRRVEKWGENGEKQNEQSYPRAHTRTRSQRDQERELLGELGKEGGTNGSIQQREWIHQDRKYAILAVIWNTSSGIMEGKSLGDTKASAQTFLYLFQSNPVIRHCTKIAYVLHSLLSNGQRL